VAMDHVLSPLLELPTNEAAPKRTYTAITRTGIASPTFTSSPALLAEGISLLETLRDSPLNLSRVIELWYADWGDDACQGALVKASCQAVEQALLPKIRADSSPTAISELCDSMFKHTSQPLRWPLSPADGAIVQAFSAEGVRWDTLGIFYVLIGVILGQMREGPDTFLFCSEKWGPDRKCAMERMLESCLQCYRICERMGQINDLTAWLLNTAIMLTTWCYGDDSYQAWRLMGDLASVVVALGFHGTIQDEPGIPLYLQEFRKRALAGAHELDKGQATFVGRPPHLSRHYVGLSPPLDLPRSVIMGAPEDLANAIARLDNGWNPDGLVHPATRIRAVSMLIFIREEALELSLGPRNSDVYRRSRYGTLLYDCCVSGLTAHTQTQGTIGQISRHMGVVSILCQIRAVCLDPTLDPQCYDVAHGSSRGPLYRLYPAQTGHEPGSQQPQYADRDFAPHIEFGTVVSEPTNCPRRIQD